MSNSMGITNQDLETALEHLTGVMQSGSSLATHYSAMEAAHDHLHKCAKAHAAAHKAARSGGYVTTELHKAHEAHMAAHESARLARLGYKSEHARHMSKVRDAALAVRKILGGGPETATATDGPTALPGRLFTSNATEANKAVGGNRANQTSPFDALRKDAKSAPRFFKNAANPLWCK
jgi:hypothetical protein